MAKLKLLMDNVIENHTVPTQLNKLLNLAENRDGKYFYQGLKLTRSEVSKDEVHDMFARAIVGITYFMDKRFHELAISSAFKNLVSLLDIST